MRRRCRGGWGEAKRGDDWKGPSQYGNSQIRTAYVEVPLAFGQPPLRFALLSGTDSGGQVKCSDFWLIRGRTICDVIKGMNGTLVKLRSEFSP
jgi:hypothetical protein